MRIGLVRSTLSPRARWHAEHWKGGSVCGALPSHTWAEEARQHPDEVSRKIGDEVEVTCDDCLYQKEHNPERWNDAWVPYGDVK